MRVELRFEEPDHPMKKLGHLVTWAPGEKTVAELSIEIAGNHYSLILRKKLSFFLKRLDLPIKNMEHYVRDIVIGAFWVHVEYGGRKGRR